MAFNAWLQEVGVTSVTGWRWRRNGWLKTVNIAGRQYISHDAIQDFTRRAQSGEFEKEHKVPKREKEAVQ